MDDRVVLLLNFQSLKTTESQTVQLRTESQRMKKDKEHSFISGPGRILIGKDR